MRKEVKGDVKRTQRYQHDVLLESKIGQQNRDILQAYTILRQK